MEDKPSEMSLDDVLLSIKQMVIDEEPPVLELTDMVSEDGSIVSLKKDGHNFQQKSSDSLKTPEKSANIGSFLKMIQEDNGGCEKIEADSADKNAVLDKPAKESSKYTENTIDKNAIFIGQKAKDNYNRSTLKREGENYFFNAVHDNQSVDFSEKIAGRAAEKASEIAEMVKNRTIVGDGSKNHESNDTMHVLIKEALTPLLKKWLEENLPGIVNKIVKEEVHNFLFKNK